MPKTVVFYGNCQAQALMELYRRQIAPRRDETVSLVFGAGEAVEPLSRADVVVEQIFDAREQIRASDVRPGAKWFRFPLVLGTFLWPYASQAHVQNESYLFLPAGPYPAELGDSYLNRLIGRVPLEEAVARYMDLDVPAHANLDRIYEINMANQYERDRASGIDVAPLIEQNFRNEPLFMTRGHSTRRIFDLIASTLFGNMGVPEDETRLAIGSYVHSMFPWDELPIHPSVIAHYGLTYLTKDSVYRYLAEGRLTFEEFVRRYLGYEWNTELYQAMHLAKRPGQDPEEALVLLDRGLAKSPQSDSGLRVKCELQVQLGRLADARDTAFNAMTADPENPENHLLLASVLLRLDDLATAEDILRRAIEIHPLGSKFHMALAGVLSRAGRGQEAAEAAALALPSSPGNADVYSLLGLMLHRNSDLDAAEQAFRQAIALAPDVKNYQSFLDGVLAQKARRALAD